MKRIFSGVAAVSLASAILIVLTNSRAKAQAVGYVTEATGIQSFSAGSGLILNEFYPGDISGTIAASSDGTALYTGAMTGSGTLTVLDVLSASTGAVVSQISGLYSTAQKTILDVTGTYAFALCDTPLNGVRNSVTIVNLLKEKVVGYVHVAAGFPVDIAMAPNGSELFVSVQPISENSGQIEQVSPVPSTQGIYTCKPKDNLPSVCIFNTEPFGLANTVSGVAGDLAVSQGGTWLYAWNPAEGTYLAAVDTASLTVSRITLPKSSYVYGFAVAPSGNQAVILAESGTSSSLLILDTKTNSLAGTFPGTPPQAPAFGSNVVAFSPDGTSLWSIGGCEVSCSLLVGQSFPSGKLISQTALGASDGAKAITF